MFAKILIANRGEIACRVMRTCRRLAIRTVAVYSSIDEHAMHVEAADEARLIGGPRPADSYLRGDRIIEAALATGAQAIHPGYGFLSENEEFARAVEGAGLVFIGPTPEAIEKMGLKDRAKAIMAAAGVPVVPGYLGERQDDATLRSEAAKLGFPLLVKAVAGGGGKGMRLVTGKAELESQLAAARREAKGAFGNDAVLLERYVTSPHHVEVQVFGDTHGNYVHLYERECSIQRRHQKVLEETPSPFVDAAMRRAMGEAAVAAARTIAYRGAGTIEFIVGADHRFYFMEMNTRLQVEHPVTEMTTGEDLVEWQLRVAAGEPLPRAQEEIRSRGHAIEVRLCAENPANDFLPETGRIGLMRTPVEEPGHVRLDTGVREGDEVSVFYDPMIAKLIAWGEDRPAAARRLLAALGETAILGVTNNAAFLERVVASDAFLAGDTDTGFIERHRGELLPAQEDVPDTALIAAAARVLRDEDVDGASQPPSPWNATDGWWTNHAPQRRVELKGPSGTLVDVEVGGGARRHEAVIAGRQHEVAMAGDDPERFELSIDGVARLSRVLRLGERITVVLDGERHELERVDPFHYEPVDTLPDARLTSLMPGRVVKVLVTEGSEVTKGQPLMILEAMKMEHTIASPRAGVIERVAFREDQLVPADAVLFAFRE